MDCSIPGFPVHHQQSLLKLMSIELVMPSNHLILCCQLLLLPSIFFSIKVFSSESVLCIRWPKYWSFSISPSNEYSGLISFRMDWLDLLAVQGTLKSLIQHHSSKASILWYSAFFMVQLSHPSKHDYWKMRRDGWMVSPTQWTWVWASCRRWWWTGKPGVLQSMGSQRVGHDWGTELNWTDITWSHYIDEEVLCLPLFFFFFP